MSAAEVLAQHQVREYVPAMGCWWCSCGTAHSAAHQLNALKDAGYAVEKLPEPHQIDVVAIDMEPQDEDGSVLAPELTIRFEGIPKPGRLFDRRDLAVALLAADAAEAAS